MRVRSTLLTGILAVATGACGSGSSVEAGDGGGEDAGHDAPTDAHHDARDASDARDAQPDVVFDAGPSAVCTPKDIETGCVAGACTVTGAASALPTGATVTVAATLVPETLAGDAIGPTLCTLTVQGATGVTGLTLALNETTAPPAGAVLFSYVSASQSELVPTSQASGSIIEGLVGAPGVYGGTVSLGTWSPAGFGGIPVSTSADTPSLLKNLSSQPTNGSFYDGTHLFVCNGPRLLVYNTLPANPGVTPDVVLGQPDLNTFEPETTSSLFGGQSCSSIWSDGQRLAVVHGSRVLIWLSIPSANQTPADLVLGQPDFSSNVENNGGVSGSSLLVPDTVDSNGTNLVVADTYNNRVLVWSAFPTTINQPADFVIGQPNLTSSGNGTGVVPINWAAGLALDATGIFLAGYGVPGVVHIPTPSADNPSSDFSVLSDISSFTPNANGLWTGGSTSNITGVGLAIGDWQLQRIAIVTPTPTTGPSNISFVLGQPDPSFTVESPVSASTVTKENYLGHGELFTMTDLSRLLFFENPPAYNFAPASRVLGQAGFTTNGLVDYRGTSPSTLADPSDVAYASEILAVADTANNRVLLYPTTNLNASDPGATIVVGQTAASSFLANVDQKSPSASTLSGPAGVALDGQHLIVADTENHRVLIWNTVPTASGTAADVVLGQTDFVSRLPNHGLTDGDHDGFADADASALFYPTGVASDGVHLYVADRVNNRVLVWQTFPTANGQAADAVLGQPTFTSVQANAGAGGYAIAAAGFNLPTGVTIAGTSLWVADTENNRAVRWDNVTTTPAPTVWLGQPNGTSVMDGNYPIPGQSFPGVGLYTPGTGTATGSVIRPRAVLTVGDLLYVTETDSNRVHFFNAATLTPTGELGQTSDTSFTTNSGGVTASSLSTPEGLASDGAHLWVADSANHRILGYDVTSDPATGAAASSVLGQLTFVTNGFNQTSLAANGVTAGPTGLSAANGTVWVADTNNHRVLGFSSPLAAGGAPTAVYGQPNGSLAIPNSGGSASASTLDAPRGVFSDGTNLVVADTGNNRVLLYTVGGSTTAASLVLGQSGFTSTATNAGGVSAATMQGPTGVFYDGVRLWVADTGNHRVLVWNSFPTSNGQGADVVLGQTSFTSDLANQGSSAATAASLAFPAGIQVVAGVTYIADSGNNRVVYYSTVPATNGASADGVLGQPSLTSRLSATSPVDLTTLAGPVGLAADAENLYVADRDLSRAVVYSLGTLKSSGPATLALGSAGGFALKGAGGIAVEQTPYFTTRVYVSSTSANEVGIATGVSRLEAP